MGWFRGSIEWKTTNPKAEEQKVRTSRGAGFWLALVSFSAAIVGLITVLLKMYLYLD